MLQVYKPARINRQNRSLQFAKGLKCFCFNLALIMSSPSSPANQLNQRNDKKHRKLFKSLDRFSKNEAFYLAAAVGSPTIESAAALDTSSATVTSPATTVAAIVATNIMLTPTSSLLQHKSSSTPSSPSPQQHHSQHHLHHPLTPTKSTITASVTTIHDSTSPLSPSRPISAAIIKSDTNFNLEKRCYKSPISVPALAHVSDGGADLMTTKMRQPNVLMSSPIQILSPDGQILVATSPRIDHHNVGNLNIFNIKKTEAENELLYDLNRTPSISFCSSSIEREDEEDELNFEDVAEDFDDRINDDDEADDDDEEDDDDDDDDEDDEEDEDIEGTDSYPGNTIGFNNNLLYQSLSALEMETNETLKLLGNNQNKNIQYYLKEQQQRPLLPAASPTSSSQKEQMNQQITRTKQKIDLTNQHVDQKTNNFLLNLNKVAGRRNKSNSKRQISSTPSPDSLRIHSGIDHLPDRLSPLQTNDQNSLSVAAAEMTASVESIGPAKSPTTIFCGGITAISIESPSSSSKTSSSSYATTASLAITGPGSEPVSGPVPVPDTSISPTFANTPDLFNIINKLTPMTLSSPSSSSSNNPFINYFNNNISGNSSNTTNNHNQKCKNSRNPFISSGGNHDNDNTHCMHFKRDEFLKATMKICLVVSPPSSKLQVNA